PDIYTLSLHDALPILLDGLPVPGSSRAYFWGNPVRQDRHWFPRTALAHRHDAPSRCARSKPPLGAMGFHAYLGRKPLLGLVHVSDRKSTRLNSSHVKI